MGGPDRPRGAVRVVRSVLANADLRRVEAAYAGFIAAEFGVWVAILVYAYQEAGNGGVVAAILAQLVPATLFAPLAGALADRYRPLRVLTAGYVAQGAGMGATAGALAVDAPLAVVFTFAGVAATAVTVTRPTQAVIVPTLARRPVELTAVNVVSTWIESAAVCVAPVLSGVLLAASGPTVVFVVFALVAFGSALLVAPLPPGAVRWAAGSGPLEGREDRGRPGVASVLADARTDIAEGVRTLRAHRPARLVMTLIGAQLFLFGALDVIAVVLAVDVLDLGSGGAGYLTGAFGLGGLFGAIAAVALVGRRRLAPPRSRCWCGAGASSRWGSNRRWGARSCCSARQAPRAACSRSRGGHCSSARRPPRCSRGSSGSSRRWRWPRWRWDPWRCPASSRSAASTRR